MSTIYPRGKTLYIDYTDQWNIRHQRSLKLKVGTGGKIPEEAKQIQKKIDSEIALGTFDTRAKIPVIPISRMLDEYLLFVGNNRDAGTIYLYKLAIKELIKFKKDMPIISVDQQCIMDFRDKLLKKSEAHASRTLRSLSPIFRFAAEERHWIPSNPITRYSAVRVSKKYIETYTIVEINQLFNWAKKRYPHFYYQIKFLYLTGFRSNESCTAEWKHIDFKRESLIHYDDKLNEWMPYPLDQELKNFLKQVPHVNGNYIFHYRDIHSLVHLHIKARTEIPLRKELKLHTLKANYVRDLIDAGISEMDAHKLSHHKSIATTHRYYATFDMKQLKKSLTRSRKKRIA